MTETTYATKRDTSSARRGDITSAICDDMILWLVYKEDNSFVLHWYGRHKIVRSTTRKPLVLLAKRLEAISDQAIWDAENAGKFETLTKAQAWVTNYESRHAGKT
jgi:hypothetical protein